jgi:hypothetical protein
VRRKDPEHLRGSRGDPGAGDCEAVVGVGGAGSQQLAVSPSGSSHSGKSTNERLYYSTVSYPVSMTHVKVENCRLH